MARYVTETMFDQLEAMVDGSKLAIVLEALQLVCHEKAEHIKANWQDEKTARTWSDMGDALNKTIRAAQLKGI